MKEAVDQFLKKHNYSDLNIKAVLFDMDGVLFDSMKFHATAWHEVMQSRGLNFSRHDAFMNEGRTGSSTINEFFKKDKGREATQEEIEAIYADKSKLFSSYGEVLPVEHVEKVLKTVQSMGLEIVIVTGSGTRSLLNRLDHYFPNVFSAEKMVTAFDVKIGKPDPEPYLMGLAKAGVEAHEAIVVENAPLGVRSARAAGIFTIAVNTGELTNDDLACEDANIVLPNMHALNELFLNL